MYKPWGRNLQNSCTQLHSNLGVEFLKYTWEDYLSEFLLHSSGVWTQLQLSQCPFKNCSQTAGDPTVQWMSLPEGHWLCYHSQEHRAHLEVYTSTRQTVAMSHLWQALQGPLQMFWKLFWSNSFIRRTQQELHALISLQLLPATLLQW